MREYGPMTAAAVGHLMELCVRRAIQEIRARRLVHRRWRKKDPTKKDYVTDADIAAQAIYVEMLRACLPSIGILAEERRLVVPGRDPTRDLYFTADGLDGTRAFLRGQAHGVATMLSLVRGTEVIAAYIGDVMSEDIYAAPPESAEVRRITSAGSVRMTVNTRRPLADQFLLLRDPPHTLSRGVQHLAGIRGGGGPFKEYDMANGSIGLSTARVWTGEAGGAIFKAGKNKPWDLAPCLCISRRRGFVFLPIVRDMGGSRTKPCWRFGDDTLEMSREIQDIPHDLLMVHRSRLPELQGWRC